MVCTIQYSMIQFCVGPKSNVSQLYSSSVKLIPCICVAPSSTLFYPWAVGCLYQSAGWLCTCHIKTHTASLWLCKRGILFWCTLIYSYDLWLYISWSFGHSFCCVQFPLLEVSSQCSNRRSICCTNRITSNCWVQILGWWIAIVGVFFWSHHSFREHFTACHWHFFVFQKLRALMHARMGSWWMVCCRSRWVSPKSSSMWVFSFVTKIAHFCHLNKVREEVAAGKPCVTNLLYSVALSMRYALNFALLWKYNPPSLRWIPVSLDSVLSLLACAKGKHGQMTSGFHAYADTHAHKLKTLSSVWVFMNMFWNEKQTACIKGGGQQFTVYKCRKECGMSRMWLAWISACNVGAALHHRSQHMDGRPATED